MKTQRFNIKIDDPEIKAHFPNNPILAAYKQIELLEAVCNKNLAAIKDVKFKSQIVPPCEVEISIDGNKFEIKVANEIKTTGKLVLK